MFWLVTPYFGDIDDYSKFSGKTLTDGQQSQDYEYVSPDNKPRALVKALTSRRNVKS